MPHRRHRRKDLCNGDCVCTMSGLCRRLAVCGQPDYTVPCSCTPEHPTPSCAMALNALLSPQSSHLYTSPKLGARRRFGGGMSWQQVMLPSALCGSKSCCRRPCVAANNVAVEGQEASRAAGGTPWQAVDRVRWFQSVSSSNQWVCTAKTP